MLCTTAKANQTFSLERLSKGFRTTKTGLQENSLLKLSKKTATSTSTVLEEVPMHLMDIEVYPAHDVICGPLTASVLRGSKWSVPDYPLAHKTFNVVQSLKREEQYHHLFIRNDNREGLYVPDKA